MNPSEAKAWLIAQILAEAERTGAPLDPLEAGMLHYAESARTPAGYETLLVAFDQQHDAQAFEARIAALVSNMHGHWRDQGDPRLAHWTNAVEALRGQDHYLLVLVAAPASSSSNRAGKQAGRRLLKIFLIAAIVTALITILLGYLARR